MTFFLIYRASFYLMMTFATLVLSIDATEDNRYAMLYPPVVAIACLVAFLTADRNPAYGLSRSTANLLALATPIPSFLEWYFGDNLELLAAAHWVVYLSLVKIFLPKTVTDDWFLFLLGLIQVLVGGVISQSDKVGIALFIWSLLALWVLTLFTLHREAIRLKKAPMGSVPIVGGDRTEPYRGLIDGPFLFATLRVAATTLALGGLIFLATPRRNSMGSSKNQGTIGKHLSGFDDQVRLGELGEILENDSPVMSIELLDQSGMKLPLDDNREYRWRGVTMDRYETGNWYRPDYRAHNNFALGLSDRGRDTPIIRQVIKLEPNDSRVLFALRPILYADSVDKHFMPESRNMDGSLYRSDTRAVTVDYTVESALKDDMTQAGESYPERFYLANLKRMPEEMRAKLRPIALQQVKNIPEENVKERAAALERFLRDSGQFTYTLQMGIEDPDMDPVEDFLLNRKAGHCEYFASALALLLRSIDIPSRMVNGFKGGDYNSVSGITTVRQKHAHSWVEALVGRSKGIGSDSRPYWMVLDPTPAEQRNRSVAQVGGIASHFYQVTDLIRYFWIFYVVGFNADRQDRLLYGPIRELIKEARYGFSIMFDAVRALLHFPSLESFFSFRGFVVSFLALLLLVGFARLLTWLVQRLIRKFAGTKLEESSGMVGIQFYRRLVHLLAEYGLERPPAETPREFARRAAIFLAGHGSGTEAVADVPPLVVDAFYQVRFGDHTIREDDFDRVTARLDALEHHLHPPKA
jgi:hypothetical protein